MARIGRSRLVKQGHALRPQHRGELAQLAGESLEEHDRKRKRSSPSVSLIHILLYFTVLQVSAAAGTTQTPCIHAHRLGKEEISPRAKDMWW